ncbi:ribonuclease H-like domain-containing protein [Tanacetum coccineum]
MDEPDNPIMPYPATPPTSPPQPESPPSHSSTPIQPQTDTHLSHSSTPIPTSAKTQSHAQMVDNHTLILINNSSQTMPTYPMVTRAKAGIFKPLERMNCHVTTTSPLPRSHVHCLCDPNGKEAMLDDYNALITNGTWVLVPCPANVNVVCSMWLFKHKFNADGSLSRYKADLVANRRSQQQGIDCDETFSLVVKLATIRTTVYMHQPPGFVDPNNPNYVFHLQRSLYGLKQAPRALFQRFASYAARVGFQHSKIDSSLFVFHRGSDIAYLLLYVDDIILTTSSLAFLQRIITSLHSEFAMTDLGSLNYFLGISAQRSASGLFLSQAKFAKEILERAHMQNCNPCRTLLIQSPSLVRMVTLSRSSAKAEHQGVANVVVETAWIRNFLCELHIPLFTATLVYCDNVSAVYMSANLVQCQRTKHIEIDIYFFRDFVASGQVRVLYVTSRF